jgi:hypothetical protein
MLATSPEDLLSEVKTLAFIAMATNRSLILPNILIAIGLDLPGGKKSRYPYFDYRVNAKNALVPPSLSLPLLPSLPSFLSSVPLVPLHFPSSLLLVPVATRALSKKRIS